MKKRRTLIISLLLVAALCLGIGYAAFSSTMTMNGEAQMGGIASQVNFKSATVNAASTATAVNTTVSGEGSKSLEIDFDGFIHASHYVLVDIVIENPHDFDVELIDMEWNNDGKQNEHGVAYFDFSSTGDIDIDTINADTTLEIPKNSTKSFQLKVLCQATSPVDVTENFSFTFVANAE